MNLEGSWTALITPMNPDGSIDRNGLEKNINFQIEQGITGLVPAGTTGESPTLVWDEHNTLVENTLELCEGRCKVIAGTGSNSTQEAIESTEHAVYHGAEAALLVDCYYNGPSSLELRCEYYGILAELFPAVSFVPYVIPGRSGTALSVEDLAILSAEYPNICAVKEATGDLKRMAYTRSVLGDKFTILSGDDDMTYAMMTSEDIRCQGVISVMSNIVPGFISQMVNSIMTGDFDKAKSIRSMISPLFGIVTVKAKSMRQLPNGDVVEVEDRFRNPLAIKVIMQGLGMPSGDPRQPLGKMTENGVRIVHNTLKQIWKDNPEVLKPIAEFYDVDIENRLSDNNIWDSLSYI